MIDINTKFVTLIGTPLSQSFAARMQNAAYDASDLNMRYFYTEVGSEHLKEIVDGIKYMPSFVGAAVTKPNKVKVLQYLDRLDPLCEKMGACNTIVKNEQGQLIGYNTDGIGFYISLTEDAKISVEGKTFFCFGAGGAGRAMCSVLAHYGAKKIYITSRSTESRRAVVDDINSNFSPIAEAVEHDDFSRLAECDVIMNASGVGMGKYIGESPLPKNMINPSALYYDACYNPAKTQFLIDAEAAGCKTYNGLGMSLYQGVRQIELWSGTKAPVEAMRRELLTIISE